MTEIYASACVVKMMKKSWTEYRTTEIFYASRFGMCFSDMEMWYNWFEVLDDHNSWFEERNRSYLLICSYKEVLLGQAKSGQVIVDATDPRNVLVRSITLVVDGRPNITMHLDKSKFFPFYIWITSFF